MSELQRIRVESASGAVRALQKSIFVEIVNEIRIIARYLIHAPVKQHDVRVIVRTPQMFNPSITITSLTVAIDLPIIDSIHGIRILLFRGHLELAPDEVLQVVLE